MSVWENNSRFSNVSRKGAIVSLIASCLSLSGCHNQNAETEDRSPRQQLADEFADCPPMLPLNPGETGWELAPAAKYRAVGWGDLVMVRAIGRDDVTYDMTLAVAKYEAPVPANAAPAGPSTKPLARKPAPAGGTGPTVVYFYRRPPTSKLSGVKKNFEVCGHIRTANPITFISIRDAEGTHSMAVEPVSERPK